MGTFSPLSIAISYTSIVKLPRMAFVVSVGPGDRFCETGDWNVVIIVTNSATYILSTTTSRQTDP